MPQVLVTDQYLSDIADAIRHKNGEQNTYTPAQMAGAIEDIGGGSDGTFSIPYYADISSDSVLPTIVYGNYYFTAVQAFGNERQHWWGANNNSQHWLKITFEKAVIINKVTFANAWAQGNAKWQSANVVFQGSNDDSTWTDLLTLTGLTLSESAVDYNINNNTPYLYYRFLCASTAADYTGLGKIKLHGKKQ